MIEYSLCNEFDCWYKGNQDSLNGSSSISFVHNQDVYERDYDLYDYKGPAEIVLCDVCSKNAGIRGKCALCERRMLDDWITLPDGLMICRFCIHEKDITKNRTDRREALFDAVKEGYSFEEIESIDPKLFSWISAEASKIYQSKQREKREEKEAALRYEAQRVKQQRTTMRKLFPELTNSQVTDVVKKFPQIADAGSVYEFLMKL